MLSVKKNKEEDEKEKKEKFSSELRHLALRVRSSGS